jgi:hypothetical protein
MRPQTLPRVAVLTAFVAGCNGLIGNDSWTLATDGSTTGPPGSEAGNDAAQLDSGGQRDADVADRVPLQDSGVPRPDATMPVDSGADAISTADTGPDASPTGLSPCLVVPPASAPTCTVINSPQVCPSFGFCAISGPAEDAGRCTNCGPQGSCSGPLNSACVMNEDCDDIFQCYCGQCRTLCILGLECGSMCMNVGNDTWGVCLN